MSSKSSKPAKSSKPKGVKPPKGSGIPSASSAPAGTGAPTSGNGAGNGAGKPGNGAPTSGNGAKSGNGASRAPSTADRPLDVASIARALFAGFIILVFGGLLTPAATHFLPPSIGQFWLIIVAVVAFATAGVWAGRGAPKPPLYGAGTAVASFVMDVPLLFLNNTFDPLYALYTVVAAAVIGAVAGIIGDRVAPKSG